MDEDEMLECAAAVVYVLAAVVSDKRNWPEEKRHVLTARHDEWKMIKSNDAFSVSWFSRNLRCTRDAFEEICRRVSARWSSIQPRPAPNTTVDMTKRVAITLTYLAQGGAMFRAGEPFGAGKTDTQTAIHQVFAVLNSMVEETTNLPTSQDEWERVGAGFEQVAGMPGVTGAVDGCLIRIKRFADFDGWYCRRGYTVFNMMAVVDHKQRFMAYSIRNGAQNDKSVFNRSIFAREALTSAPPGTHLVGDAGYQLMANIMTYPILPQMEPANRWYNLVHSRTRIAVEQAFGRLKGKFRVFKSDLALETPTAMAALIQACLVLHNWIIDLDGTAEEEPLRIEDWMELDRVWWAGEEDDAPLSAKAKRDAIRDSLYAVRVGVRSAWSLDEDGFGSGLQNQK